jgi:hypothetical protein
VAARLSDHQRPADGQTLPAAVASNRRRDRGSITTLTRHRTWQLDAGQTQPHPRPLTTSRTTARWSSKEAHPRPTDRRTSTEAASSTTRRDRSNTLARPQYQENEETQSASSAALWTETAASTPIDHQPHDRTVHAHPRASESDTSTVTVTNKGLREKCSTITLRRHQDNEETLATAAAACWNDTDAPTPSRPHRCRATVTSRR